MTIREAETLPRGAAVQVVRTLDDEIPEVIAHVRRHLGERGRVLAPMDDCFLLSVLLDSGDRYQFSPEELAA